MKSTTDALVEALEELAECGAGAWGEDCPCVKDARAALALARAEQSNQLSGNSGTLNLMGAKQLDPANSQVCCGEYRTCNQACTPRGLWRASHSAPVPQPVQVLKPLRGEQIYDIASKVLPEVLGYSYFPEWVIPLARAIEAAHGITPKEGG